MFISAYTVGSGSRDAGVLDMDQATSAANAALLTALAIGVFVLIGAFFVGRTPRPTTVTTAADGLPTAAPAAEVLLGDDASDDSSATSPGTRTS